jgi:hypothetical protein
MPVALKVALTAVLVVAVSEAAKRSILLGAVLASLPLTSLLALVWLYRDTGDAARAASLASGVLWAVIPSLVLFIVFPALVRRGWGFWPALGTGCLATAGAYPLFLGAMRRLGVAL